MEFLTWDGWDVPRQMLSNVFNLCTVVHSTTVSLETNPLYSLVFFRPGFSCGLCFVEKDKTVLQGTILYCTMRHRTNVFFLNMLNILSLKKKSIPCSCIKSLGIT